MKTFEARPVNPDPAHRADLRIHQPGCGRAILECHGGGVRRRQFPFPHPDRAKNQRMAGRADRRNQSRRCRKPKSSCATSCRLPATFSPDRTTRWTTPSWLQLKGELAKIQAERIARQTRYELTLRIPRNTLAEVLDDGVLRGYQAQTGGAEAGKAALEITYTAKHEKVQKIDAQIASVQKSYDNEINNVIKRD